MMKTITTIFWKKFFVLLLLNASVVIAQTGNIQGVIKDSQTHEPLPYSNVVILNSSMGAAADKSGNYIIRNIPVGNYTLRATYVGYKEKEITIDVQRGRTVEYNFELDPVTLEGKTVTVTAQAEGQYQAINEQLNSTSIKNVVSAARIQELPDANAAESVGRLPGVSLIREGGEGSKVVIRGLSPQYNQITIDGVEMASDVASANNVTGTDANQLDAGESLLGDRGIDLSMISSNMLGGIEVIKAITPDMDAAVLGGVVNFDMRKASKESAGNGLIPKFSILSQGGYNALKDTKNDYKFVGSVEKRFSDSKFGVFAQGSIEKRNLSSNELGAGYVLTDVTHGEAGIPELSTLNLADVFRIRKRYDAALVLDYQNPNSGTNIGFMNLISNSDTKATRRSERAQLSSGLTNEQLHYGIENDDEKLTVFSSLLSIKQDIPFFHVDLKLSQSFSETKDPGNVYFDFNQQHAGLVRSALIKLPPQATAKAIQYNDSLAFLWGINTTSQITDEHLYSASLDFLHDFTFSDLLSANLKFGGMYQYRYRTYNYDIRNGSVIYDNGTLLTNKFGQSFPWLYYNGNGLSLANFVVSNQYITNDYSYGEFLNGDYKLGYPLNADLVSQLAPIALATNSTSVGAAGYQQNFLGSTINDYHGHEVKDAAYAMFNLKIGDQLSILPGARYQNLTTTYTAARGTIIQQRAFQPPEGQSGFFTTKTQSHGYLLPMVHVNYKPLSWLQAHFAYTNTLHYPDYSTITPRYIVTQNYVEYNNPQLKPSTSENYDLVLSVFNNDIGFLSIDGFYKRIKDLIFYSHTFTTDLSQYPELPPFKGTLYQLTTYINSPIPVNVKGVETDWQTHFWYLPEPFSGLILNINYTHIFSDATYPKTVYNVSYDNFGNAIVNIVDTSYTTRLLNQPNDIVNLAVGYDYKGFSLRVSMLYQNNIFKNPDFWYQLRIISDKYTRWDLSVKQDLPWYGIQLFLNLNNITGENEVDLNQKNSFPANEQRYGMSGDLGLRVSL